MFLWLALLIPLFTAAILALFFHHKTLWWEFAIPFVASILMVVGFKYIATDLAKRDTEIWNDYAIEAQYYERWNEYIHQTCSRQNCTGFGKDQTCTTEFYDCSYVANHPEHWVVHTYGKEQISVDRQTYNYFVKLYGLQPTFKDMRRRFHTVDGDMYFVHWPGSRETVEPVNIEHSYENPVQASRSVFNYERIAPEKARELGLFEYPKVTYFNYPSVLGNCGPKTKQANAQLAVDNALLGASKQVRMWLLCTQNPDPTFGQQQESYWVGGNKNEVVAIVGVKPDGGVMWSHVFSWSDRKQPLIEIRDILSLSHTLDPVGAVEVMTKRVQEGFVRKQFADFSYLTVEVPNWAYLTTFICTLLLNVGLSYYIVRNEFEEGNERRRKDVYRSGHW